MRRLVSRASAASEASGTRPGTQRKTREAQYCEALRALILMLGPHKSGLPDLRVFRTPISGKPEIGVSFPSG
jgi:hypothetical protein